MSCYMCLPTCDNCRPKMVTCPSCKQPLTDEAKEQAWEAWRAKRAQGE